MTGPEDLLPRSQSGEPQAAIRQISLNEVSYWRLNPILKIQLLQASDTLGDAPLERQARFKAVFGDVPRVVIEIADDRGLFDSLSERQVSILVDYFGNHESSLGEAGITSDVSSERIRQILKVVAKRLKPARDVVDVRRIVAAIDETRDP